MGSSKSTARHRRTPAWWRGRSSSCLVGSFLIQLAVQVHGNRHGRNLWTARGKSATLSVTPQAGFRSQPIASIPSGHEEEEPGVPRKEGSAATLGQMVVHGAAPAPCSPLATQASPSPAAHLQAMWRQQHSNAQALTSKAAMPAATPPTTPALVLISSKI